MFCFVFFAPFQSVGEIYSTLIVLSNLQYNILIIFSIVDEIIFNYLTRKIIYLSDEYAKLLLYGSNFADNCIEK